MLTIPYTHASVVLAILHHYMLPNKQSNRSTIIIQYDVSDCVIYTLNKAEYLDKEEGYKNCSKEVRYCQFK